MVLSDFHVHTCFCDGKDTPEDIVLAALSKGMKKLGFSGHAYVSFDKDANMSPEATKNYKAEINRLKEKYSGQIKIFLGTEQDYYSDFYPEGYDYVIGSVHYVEHEGKYIAIDHTVGHFENLIKEFGGDVYAVAEKYFSTVADVVNKTGAKIIGHFDLLSKFNDGNKYFDEENPRYLNAAFGAVDSLLKTGRPFEINTGAISRGYKKFPYPSKKILEYIAAHNGSVILSSDAHNKENLMYRFQECEALADSLGLKIVEL